jgi:hypothetical protein
LLGQRERGKFKSCILLDTLALMQMADYGTSFEVSSSYPCIREFICAYKFAMADQNEGVEKVLWAVDPKFRSERVLKSARGKPSCFRCRDTTDIQQRRSAALRTMITTSNVNTRSLTQKKQSQTAHSLRHRVVITKAPPKELGDEIYGQEKQTIKQTIGLGGLCRAPRRTKDIARGGSVTSICGW